MHQQAFSNDMMRIGTMHTKHIVIFGGVACILAMLAYLFVFADAPIVGFQQPPAGSTAQ